MTGPQNKAAAIGTTLPKQARAKRTYEKILTSAQEILAESGLEAINSNSIVERAGVTAPVFYRYFKDKYALLLVLGDRLTQAQNTLYEATAGTHVSTRDAYTDRAEKLLSETYHVTARFTGAYALLLALRSVPNISSIRIDANREMAELSVPELKMLRPELSEEEAYDRCRLAIEIGYSAIEMLLEDASMSKETIFRQVARAAASVCFD